MIYIPYENGVFFNSTVSTFNVKNGTFEWTVGEEVDVPWATDISRVEAHSVIGLYDTIIDDLMARIKKLEDTLTIMGIEISEDQIEELL